MLARSPIVLYRVKRSVGLDLKDPQARDIYYKPARETDVLAEENVAWRGKTFSL